MSRNSLIAAAVVATSIVAIDLVIRYKQKKKIEKNAEKQTQALFSKLAVQTKENANKKFTGLNKEGARPKGFTAFADDARARTKALIAIDALQKRAREIAGTSCVAADRAKAKAIDLAISNWVSYGKSTKEINQQIRSWNAALI